MAYVERRTGDARPIPKSRTNPFGTDRRKVDPRFQDGPVTELLMKIRAKDTTFTDLQLRLIDEFICEAVDKKDYPA